MHCACLDIEAPLAYFDELEAAGGFSDQEFRRSSSQSDAGSSSNSEPSSSDGMD